MLRFGRPEPQPRLTERLHASSIRERVDIGPCRERPTPPGRSFRTACGNSPLLGEFGRSALQTRDIGQILQRATELCAQGLETPFAKVLEYVPDDKRLLVRAGVGWASGVIGQVSLGVDLESPAGYAFQTGQMVISNHLQEETRFRTPKLLSDHGIRRAINVLIARGGEGHLPFGVLEVDSPEPGQFDVADADFLAGFAGLLGIAIERQHADADLREALDHQAMLTREMSHRVKNSLASVVGLLRVQSRSAQSEEVRDALKDAASRITTIAQVHDHLWRSTKIGFVDIADFAGELCRKLQETVSHTVRCTFGHLMISADKAIPLGLLINELVTNSAKHAYPERVRRNRGIGRTARRRLACGGVGPRNWPSEGFRYRPAPGEPGLQGDQEPARSTRRTH